MKGKDLPDGVHALAEDAARILHLAKQHELSVATAESCTGGLLASLLTDIEGLSGSFERGFVTYSEEAKQELLGVPRDLLEAHGAVSRPVALAMVEGALAGSKAHLGCAITGFAGKGQKPDDEEGLVFIAAARKGSPPLAAEFHFGECGREEVRHHTVAEALKLMEKAIRREEP